MFTPGLVKIMVYFYTNWCDKIKGKVAFFERKKIKRRMTMSIDLSKMPKLGFGLMRLPEKDGICLPRRKKGFRLYRLWPV